MRILFIVIVLSSNISLFSDTTIYYGIKDNEITVDNFNNELWVPQFFDVDSIGNIHIPDFYKNRIVIFKPDGTLLSAVKVDNGLSPKMNYFKLLLNGDYIVFDNNTLLLLGKNGVVKNFHKFSLGIIPKDIIVSKSAICIKFQNNDYNYYDFYLNPINKDFKVVKVYNKYIQGFDGFNYTMKIYKKYLKITKVLK